MTALILPPGVSAPQALTPVDTERWYTMFQTERDTSSGVRVTHKSLIGYPPFWRGVNLICNALAGLPVHVFRRLDNDDREIATGHPTERLLTQKASPILRARKLFTTLQSHALIFGNGYAWIERNPQNFRPMALWILDPANMLIRYIDGELWYQTTIDGQNVKFPGRNILHIPGLAHNGFIGYSVIDIMAEALGVGMAAQRFGSRFFGNGANLSGILMVPGHMNESKIRNTLDAWSHMSQGLENAHKVALVQGGVKFQPYSVNPEQAQFVGVREYEVREVVASVLGVPPHLLGDSSRTSYNSLEQENQSFLNHSLNPHLKEWESEMQCKLLSDREQDRHTHFIEFNRDAAVQMLFKERVDGLYRQVEMGQLTINESRRKVNLPGIGPDGDKRYHPANWVEVGAEEVLGEEDATTEDSEMDEEQEENQAENTLRAVLHSSVTESIRIEKQRVIDCSKKPDNFCSAIDSFYQAFVNKVAPGLSSDGAMQVKVSYAQESQKQLLDVAGSSTSATLNENVKSLVHNWDGRAEEFTVNLMRTVQ